VVVNIIGCHSGLRFNNFKTLFISVFDSHFKKLETLLEEKSVIVELVNLSLVEQGLDLQL
jgi:hypothetical protein